MAIHRQSKSRRGATMVWLLLALTGIVGVVALGMDGGRLMEERRRVQAAADGAALAAANEMYENYWRDLSESRKDTLARESAENTAAANGYNNDGVTSVVTVNSPPSKGSFQGSNNHVEVIVEATLPATFARLFLRESLQVRGRAVALGRPSRPGLLLLRPSGADAFHDKALLFTMIGSPIIVNSNDPAAFHQEGLGVLVANSFEVTGGIDTGLGIMLGRRKTGVRPTADPLRFLPPPDKATLPLRSAAPLRINSLLPRTLQPGVYQGGIQIVNLSTVIMQPGTYYMDGGGFEITDAATVIGNQVMIYNGTGAFPAGPISIDSLGKIALFPPLSGAYQGIGIFQERSSNQPIRMSGLGSTVVAGLVYGQKAPTFLTGLAAIGVDILGGSYIVDSMEVTGVGSINIDLGTNLPRIPEVVLVE